MSFVISMYVTIDGSSYDTCNKGGEYLKYSFYPYVLIIFLVVFFTLNKFPNSLNIHIYD